MHRTQVNLEDWQYESLLSRSDSEGRSLSDLVREAVTEYLVDEDEDVSAGILALEGIGDDPETTAQDHDRILYGDPRS